MNLHVLAFEPAGSKSGYGVRVNCDAACLRALGHTVEVTVIAPHEPRRYLDYVGTKPAAATHFRRAWDAMTWAARSTPDALIVEGLWLVDGARALGKPWSLVAHNVEGALARARAEQARGLLRWGYGLVAARTGAYERALVRRAPLVVATSADDAAALKGFGTDAIVTVPNISALPARRAIDGSASRTGVLLLGTWDYEPNRESLRWFLRHVWPGLSAEDVPVSIVGRHLDPRTIVGYPGLRYVGQVDALEPWLDNALALCVPLQMGSGTRVKILDAWMRGCPVVSTRAGAAGLDVRCGENALLADDGRAMAQCIIRLRDEALARRLIFGGWEITDREYSNQVFAERWRDVIARVTA